MKKDSALTQTILGLSNQHIIEINDCAQQVSDNHHANHGAHYDVLAPLQALIAHANRDGFNLKLASSFRDFDRQLSIFNRKASGELAILDEQNQRILPSEVSEDELIKAILHFSALPGASRHHWGSDFDFYDPSLLPKDTSLSLTPWEYQQDGYFYPLTCWLDKHAINYGFYRPYDKYRQGVAVEPWHFSYLPVAKQFQRALSVDTLKTQLLASDILLKDKIVDNISTIYQQYVINVAEFPNV